MNNISNPLENIDQVVSITFEDSVKTEEAANFIKDKISKFRKGTPAISTEDNALKFTVHESLRSLETFSGVLTADLQKKFNTIVRVTFVPLESK